MVDGEAIKKRYKGAKVRVYFSDKNYAEVVKDAEKAGKRRVGLVLWKQKEHGFANQREANTDGLAKFLKFCYGYWKDHEADRLRQLAELQDRERRLAEEKKKLGVV